jgi:hypothetical protein
MYHGCSDKSSDNLFIYQTIPEKIVILGGEAFTFSVLYLKTSKNGVN